MVQFIYFTALLFILCHTFKVLALDTFMYYLCYIPKCLTLGLRFVNSTYIAIYFVIMTDDDILKIKLN